MITFSAIALLSRPRPSAGRYARCFSFGTTQVPVARQTTTGSARTSAAESDRSGRGTITFRASKRIAREVAPARTISPSASTKSPAWTGARNSIAS